jgi:hypothetical protein
MPEYNQPIPGIWEGPGVRRWLAIIASEVVMIVVFAGLALAQ